MLIAALTPCAALADAMPFPPEPAQVVATATSVPLPVATGTAGPSSAATWVPGRGSTSSSANGFWWVIQAFAFLYPLLLTLLIEVPIIAAAGKGARAAWKTGFLINTLTNPIAVFAYLLLLPSALKTDLQIAPYALLAGIELAVVLVEWRVFRWVLGWTNGRALITAIVANAASLGFGLAVTSWWIRL
jgi:hypothetical protein